MNFKDILNNVFRGLMFKCSTHSNWNTLIYIFCHWLCLHIKSVRWVYMLSRYSLNIRKLRTRILVIWKNIISTTNSELGNGKLAQTQGCVQKMSDTIVELSPFISNMNSLRIRFLMGPSHSSIYIILIKKLSKQNNTIKLLIKI